MRDVDVRQCNVCTALPLNYDRHVILGRFGFGKSDGETVGIDLHLTGVKVKVDGFIDVIRAVG